MAHLKKIIRKGVLLAQKQANNGSKELENRYLKAEECLYICFLLIYIWLYCMSYYVYVCVLNPTDLSSNFSLLLS